MRLTANRHRIDKPAAEMDQEMEDDTMIKPDPDQPRETTETAEP